MSKQIFYTLARFSSEDKLKLIKRKGTPYNFYDHLFMLTNNNSNRWFAYYKGMEICLPTRYPFCETKKQLIDILERDKVDILRLIKDEEDYGTYNVYEELMKNPEENCKADMTEKVMLF